MNDIFERVKRMMRKRLKRNYKLVKVISLLIICFSIVSVIIILADSTLSVFTVSINGKSMGQVHRKNQVYMIVDSVEKDLSRKYGTEAFVKDSMISFKKEKVSEIEPLNEEEVIRELSKSENSFLKSWVMTVEGDNVVALNSKEKADRLINDLKNHFLKEGGQYQDVYFKEAVEIKEKNLHANELFAYEDALRYILTGTTELKEHQIRRGESLWTIAERHQISLEDLESANPDIDPDKLQIGQSISLVIPKPYITVVTTEKAVVSEKIMFENTYEKTEALYEGEEQIKKEGIFGVKEINSQVTRENGEIVSTEIIETAVIKEPLNQIVLLGTKAIPSSLGTGALDNPSRGMLTSVFGRRWGRMHSGIDIANDKGTPIVAADGGVVTFTGWKGNYGLLVIISHGNNRTTYYGHCDEILVSQGDVVEKGKVIAKMGNTGNATGVHLHFEVRVNDIPQDPLKYVEYTIN